MAGGEGPEFRSVFVSAGLAALLLAVLADGARGKREASGGAGDGDGVDVQPEPGDGDGRGGEARELPGKFHRQRGGLRLRQDRCHGAWRNIIIWSLSLARARPAPSAQHPTPAAYLCRARPDPPPPPTHL